MSTGLSRYDAACRAIAQAHRVDEVKTIRDKAVAMQAYARQAKDTTLITQATEIRMRAERRAGELLIEMAARSERRSVHGDQKSGLQLATPILADLGINKTQSSRWQRLAALPTDSFEAKVEGASIRLCGCVRPAGASLDEAGGRAKTCLARSAETPLANSFVAITFFNL